MQVGRIRNRRANTKNGSMPSMAGESRLPSDSLPFVTTTSWATTDIDDPEMATRRLPLRKGKYLPATPASTSAQTICLAPLLDAGADDAVPVPRDHRLGRVLVLDRREHGLVIGRRRRQLGDQVARDRLVLDQILEADRVAIATQPGGLSLVGIEIFQPQLGGVQMRRKGTDRLDIDAGDDARTRHDDLDLRIALQRVSIGERVIVPAQD